MRWRNRHSGRNYVKPVLTAVFVPMLVGIITVQSAVCESLTRDLLAGGSVLMIRHANAPGSGDPENFRIDRCETQRNLDEKGRGQARRIGGWLRRQGMISATIFSSQWCRCLETARLMDLGPVTELQALNSFYERPRDREPNLASLRSFLSQLPANGAPILMITHFVTISGITSLGVASGEGVLLRLDGKGGFDVVGRLAFGL